MIDLPPRLNCAVTAPAGDNDDIGRDGGIWNAITTVQRNGTAAAGSGRALAGDADRERVIGLLTEGFAEGRLSGQEHGVRVERALSARTLVELSALSADLPAGSPTTLRSRADAVDAAHRPAPSPRTSPLALACLACGLIPVLPATLAALVLGIAARRQIARTGDRGAMLANAGLALGALWIVLTLIVLLAL